MSDANTATILWTSITVASNLSIARYVATITAILPNPQCYEENPVTRFLFFL